MRIHTQAIVLQSLKYSDTSLIVKCFTQEKGLCSFLLRGILSKKKTKVNKALFQPLSLLNLECSYNEKANLNSIYEATSYCVTNELHTDFQKQFITYFITEVLSKVITDTNPDEELYQFLEASIQWLDLADQVANFHLVFMVFLAKHLGFYFHTENSELPFYSIENMAFSIKTKGLLIQKQDLVLLKQLLGINFDESVNIRWSRNERQQVLEVLLRIYRFHIPSFGQLKSVEVLSSI